jgi:hypothetical protein
LRRARLAKGEGGRIFGERYIRLLKCLGKCASKASDPLVNFSCIPVIYINLYCGVQVDIFHGTKLMLQGKHHLKQRDIPLEAVDHHVSNSILTPLLSDDKIIEEALALSSTSRFRGEDPQSILKQMMWAFLETCRMCWTV